MRNRGELKNEIVDIPAFVAEKVSEELHQQAGFIHTVLNTIYTLVTVLDRQGRILLFNNACETLTGYTFHDVKGKPIWGFIPPEEKAGVERVVQEIETGTAQYPIHHVNHWLSREGSKYLIAWSNSVLKNSEGHVQYVVCTGINITEQVRVEKELRESEERSRLLVELSPDSILLHQNGKIVFANPATARMLGAESVEDILGLEYINFIQPEYQKEFHARTKSIYDTGLPSPFMQKKYLRIDGGIIDIEVTGSLSSFQGKPAIQLIIRDITERKKLEQDTLTADKLQSVGNLAGAIAHEFNNLLTVILGNLSVARMYGNQHEKGAGVLYEAEQAAQQARELTQRLLTFARGGQPVKQPVDLRKLIFKSCNAILSEEFITCRVNVAGDLYTVEADEGQIVHAISNIVVNGVQAMPGGGKIDISAENYSTSKFPGPPLKFGRYVKITIVDEGHGIAECQLCSIFDPFYSTKPESSGLGLPTAHSIIKKHGGHLMVESVVGKGATFTIYLPAGNSKVEKEEKEMLLVGSGWILLMDDEASVRRTAKEMLRLLGYDVIEAADGQEALRLYREASAAGQQIDLAILDLVVKDGLGGKETMESLRLLDSNIKVLVSSGYSNDPVMSDYEKYGFSGCVPKPYAIEQLGHALRLALQAP
jgi:PAS domain S-box-containing protein